MEIEVIVASKAVLTTEHSSSSYGIPVLVYNGHAFSPQELPKHIRIVAAPRTKHNSIIQLARKVGYDIIYSIQEL